MKVPNWRHATVDRRKLTDYLLSATHPVGRFKSRFFSALGYEAEESQVLEDDLLELLKAGYAESMETEFGTKFLVSGDVCGPNGSVARVVAVWIILLGEENPRFVTAYPES